MADVKWIKITTDIFDDEKILLIESLPDAYAIITVWFKLLCLAGKQNNSGVFMMGRIPYTEKMLATIFRMKEATVTMALQTFEQFGMVEIVDGVITIPNWDKHQTLDAYEKKKERDRLYQAERRANQRALIGKSSDTSSDTSADSSSYVAISEEDREEDEEVLPKGNTKKKPAKHKHGEFKNVLLTENEFENLANSFGIQLRDKAIKFLDEYIEEKGYKSKSHNLAIRRWVIDAVSKDKPKKQINTGIPVATDQSDLDELF
jgi:predicted phage replisome organizer